MALDIRIVPAGQMSVEVAADVISLWREVWPTRPWAAAETTESLCAWFAAWEGLEGKRPRHFLAYGDDGTLTGIAQVFPRTVKAIGANLQPCIEVLALARVCSKPAVRGKGIGAALVGAAFLMVDEGAFGHCFFEVLSTNVPFYARYGARAAQPCTECVDSTQPGGPAPFWLDVTMVYGDAEWPAGQLDTLGPGW